jgi:Zn-dependent protease
MGLGSKRWKVATVRGIPLYIGSSWIWVAALYIYLTYLQLTNDISVSRAEGFGLAVFATFLFFGSVLIHEAAHAVMARVLGLPVAGITLVFWGGATETRANARGALGEFLVSFVGPVTTLAMAGVFWVGADATTGTIAEILGRLATISLLFAAVNALPGFPLDGGRMLLATVWAITGSRRTAMRAAGWSGIAIGGAMIIAAVLEFSGEGRYFLILGYIGFVLVSTGRSMEGRINLRDELAGATARDAMRNAPTTVPANMSLSSALDEYLRGTDGDAFPVVDGGRVIGTVSRTSARRVGGRNPLRPVRDGVMPLNQTPVVSPDDPLDDVLEWLGGRDGLVLQDGMLVGAIGPRDVERWYRRAVRGERIPDDGIPPRPDF